MKRKTCLWLLVALAALTAAPVLAYRVDQLPIEEQAYRGANWAVTFTYADFTNSVTNTVGVFSNQVAVAAKTGVKCVGMVLKTAFTVSDTNYVDSCLIKVGDSADEDRYLTSTELASDGTEVFYKYPPMNSGTIALTPSFATITNGSSTWYAWTNATAAFTAASLGSRLYTAADHLVFTFTPNAEWALDDFVAWEVVIYFQIDK